MKLEVSPSREALFEAAAERFAIAASEAIRTAGRFHLALSGGSTPRGLYALLAKAPHAARVAWPRVHVFWGDERCVAPQDPASNQRMAHEALLDHVPLPGSQVHPIQGENDPATAAAGYERALRDAFATPAGPPRSAPGARFDLVLLGLGEDGHTASLFPGTRAVHEHRRWVVAERIERLSAWRVTLTPLVINAASEVIFLVSGRAKAAILRQVLCGPREPDRLPAQAISPSAGELRWLVDADAASALDAPRSNPS
ncbi:MAG TPA: 6-phosphogluconolactonase [Myxococcota bacterium]